MTDSSAKPLRIVHWVTGGATGATRVALDLALAQAREPGWKPELIFRDKGRALPAVMQQQIADAGIPLHWVKNLLPRGRVVSQLRELCGQLKPDVFFAHGYSEHIWGRRAAIAAQVPLIIHVEHNVERYLPWRVWAARKLKDQTHATACVSTAVEENVRRLGIASARTLTVHNGVDLSRFTAGAPLTARAPDLLMPARFARSKDQPTLIRAAKLLIARGWSGQLLLAGGGKPGHRQRAVKLVKELGLQERVQFLGNVNDLPQRLARCRVAVLSSYREGLPLVMAEAMAAGCAVVGSRIPGITDILRDDAGHETGWLFAAGDAQAAADALWKALTHDAEAQRRADYGREQANGHFSQQQMAERYRELLLSLLPR